MLLSILIPTLDERAALFERIYSHLQSQIAGCGAAHEVEVLYLRDDRVLSTGEKRNRLVQAATGEFVSFVDDDDRVSNGYVSSILEILRGNSDVDCIGIRVVKTFKGKHAREYVQSLQYRDYFSRNGKYYGPPYILNPIRRSIAARYPFMPVSYSEDMEWALRLSEERALKKEKFLDAILYHYDSRRDYLYQWLLDKTESFRHALGLRAANRLKLAKFLPVFRDIGV